MEIELGSEKEFANYISRLSDKDKIIIISHTDLDGITSGLILNKIISADEIIFVNYDDLSQSLVDKLKKEDYNKVIFSDLYVGEKLPLNELEKFAEVLVVDHHVPEKDWNSPRTTYLKCEAGYCAGYFAYRLASKITNLEKYDWLVACACIADFCHIKTADWLSQVFSKYGDIFKIKDNYVRKSGKIWQIQWTLSLALVYYKDNPKEVYNHVGSSFGDIGQLEEKASQVDKEITSLLSKFDKEKQEFPGGYLYELNPNFGVSSIVSSIISSREPDKKFAVIRKDGDSYRLSIRRQDKKQDLVDFIHKLLNGLENASGGGHIPAVGGSFLVKDLPIIKERLGIKPRLKVKQ